MPNKKEQLLKTSLLMIVLTVISKLFGFVREVLLAGFYGSSFIIDAYNLVQGIPGILFGGILTSIATGFTPVYTRIEIGDNGKEKANLFASKLLTIGILFSLMIFVVCFIFSDSLVRIFASGFTGETFRLASYYVKVVSAFSIFTFSSGIFTAMNNYHGKYLVPIVNGYLQNFVCIPIIIISSRTSYYYLIYGLLLGLIAKNFADFLSVRKTGFKYSATLKSDENIKEIIQIAIPVFIGSYIADINTMVDKFIASRLPEGSISNLHYANLVVTLLLALTSSVINTIMYPNMSRSYASGEIKNFSQIIKQSISLVLIFTIPLTIATQLFSNQVIQVIFERGAFSISSTENCAKAFAMYGLGLVFLGLNSILISAFYSMKDVKTPLIASSIAIVVNIVLNILLSRKIGFTGLALATSIATFVSFTIRCIQLKVKYNISSLPNLSKIVKILISSLISVIAAWIIYPYLSAISQIKTIMLALAAVIAIVIYALLLFIFRIEELSSMFSR